MDKLSLVATFCQHFIYHKIESKRQILSGTPVDDVLEDLFLHITSDLCRTLNGEKVHEHGAGDTKEEEYHVDESAQDCVKIEQLYQMEQNMVVGENAVNQTQSKQFLCDYPGCGNSYKNKSNLSRHQKLHYATKKYHCLWTGCHHSSIYRENILRHIEKLHLNCRLTSGPDKKMYRQLAQTYVQVVANGEDAEEHSKQSPTSKRSVSSKVKVVQQQQNSMMRYRCSEKSCSRLFVTKLGLIQHLGKHQRRPFVAKQRDMVTEASPECTSNWTPVTEGFQYVKTEEFDLMDSLDGLPLQL